MKQYNILDYILNKKKITKPIRLIELFGGYGSQAIALEKIGAEFSSHHLCEWEPDAVRSYKAIHYRDVNTDYSEGLTKEEIIDYLYDKGISFDGSKPNSKESLFRKNEDRLREIYNAYIITKNLGSIVKVHGDDLEINDIDKYEYMLTYSWPCQSLSLAGKKEGMKKGSGTVSSLLWEVQRILKELYDSGKPLPQTLFAENVSQVLNKHNIEDFEEWVSFLNSIGYRNYYSVLNAKDYGIPQNRKRFFMFSFLGDYTYEFPEKEPLKLKAKDLLEHNADESYYIKTDKAKNLIKELIVREDIKKEEDILKNIYIYKDNYKKRTFLLEYNFKHIELYNIKKIYINIQYKKDKYPNIYMTDYSDIKKYNYNIIDFIKGSSESVVAMRGRNPYNPNSRIAGQYVKQRLELNHQGLSNTITTVQKDNLILHRNEMIGSIEVNTNMQFNPYKKGNIIKCLKANKHDLCILYKTKPIKIFEDRTDGIRFFKDNCCGTVRTKLYGGDKTVLENYNEEILIRQATKKGYISCKNNGLIDAAFPGSKYRRGRVINYGEISPTLQTSLNNIINIKKNCLSMKGAVKYGNSYYRIRRLTPLEAGRFMGVPDEYIEIMKKINSNCALYKLFGNSIVVDVMEKMFSNLF